MGQNERGALFRQIVPNQHSRVTYAELFFDLVFVFAVTQISHTLLGRLTSLGLVQTTMLFLAVWWVWVYTSWITNWLNPELTPVRVLLFLLMLGGLVLSTSIPKAFESRGMWFALAYAAMQVGKTVFLWVSTPACRSTARLNAVRSTTWLARLAYTYLHMPIVAGIIISAVADELVLTHPAEHSDLKTVLSAIGGPMLFLIGTILFKHTFRGFLQLSGRLNRTIVASAGFAG